MLFFLIGGDKDQIYQWSVFQRRVRNTRVRWMQLPTALWPSTFDIECVSVQRMSKWRLAKWAFTALGSAAVLLAALQQWSSGCGHLNLVWGSSASPRQSLVCWGYRVLKLYVRVSCVFQTENYTLIILEELTCLGCNNVSKQHIDSVC